MYIICTELSPKTERIKMWPIKELTCKNASLLVLGAGLLGVLVHQLGLLHAHVAARHIPDVLL